jgi:uncharacterized repeat protein (TIGR01451 family)
MREISSPTGGAKSGRRLLSALVLPVLAASLLLGAGPLASQSVQAAGPSRPTVVSDELRAALAKRANVAAVVTVHRREDLAAIRRLGIRGGTLRVLPMMLVPSLNAGQLRALEASGLVRSVFPKRSYPVRMEDSSWIVGARYVWGPSRPTRFGAGYTGKGVDIAVIDTGIDGKHEDTDNLVEFCDTTAAATGERTEVVCAGGNSPTDSAAARAVAFDDEGHGSHVSGTVAGSGDASGGMNAQHSTIGVAPEADLHVYSANVGPVLLNFQILAAYDDMIHKKLNANSGVVATSNSFGGGDGANYAPDDPQNVAIKAAYDAGIVSVYAAGNSGPEHNTLSDSCINPYVVCVGATTKPDSVVMFSSRGRPSEPADTNRNGIVGDNGDNGTPSDTSDDIPADVPPDNHDRLLGQRLGLGLYRPTLVAPGVNINSISANAPGCKEAADPDAGCYEPLNGTSMATPHVSGAIGILVQGWRQKTGDATFPNDAADSARIIDLLERSAQMNKLPGYEAEEQGAGRLDVLTLIRHIKDGMILPKPSYGTPSPPYVGGKDPRSVFLASRQAANIAEGCTAAMSFTAASTSPLDEPADQPPTAAGRAGQHSVTVPVGAERLRVTVRWPDHFGANLYVRLWRPGTNPNTEFAADPTNRAFPDQEAIGLADTDAILNAQRFLDVRAPEAGTWLLRVYHRAGGEPGTCDPPGPEATGGYSYEVLTEIPIASQRPTVAITHPAAGSTHTARVIPVRGTASYPSAWNGTTNWEVPGSGIALGGDAEDPRIELHLQGNTEEGCTGDGSTDLSTASCNGGDGPSLLAKTALSDSPPASYQVLNPILGGNAERSALIPNWIWDIDSARTLRGPMTVSWWASCSACGPTLGSADWTIRLYADGKQAFARRVTATPAGPDIPTLLSVTVDLPEIEAKDRIVLHIDPVYIDSQNNVRIYYDSKDSCSGESGQPACDSTVRLPVVDPNNPQPPQVRNLRVTDIHTGLRIAFDPSPGATAYEIHRSTNPAFVPSASTRITTLINPAATCTSPSVPTWPGASDGGAICYIDSAPAQKVTHYYRVVSTQGSLKADPSLLAYGAETLYDRQVRIKANRLYGPQLWGPVWALTQDARSWKYNLDTLGTREAASSGVSAAAVQSHTFGARSFTQGIGSATVNRTVSTSGPAPETPFDPVVLFTKSGPTTAARGTDVTYTLRYQNFGPAPASSARVVDFLPAGMRFISASNGGTYDASRHRVTWQLGTVRDGASGAVTVKVRIPATATVGTVYVNQARFMALLTTPTPLGVAKTTVTR